MRFTKVTEITRKQSGSFKLAGNPFRAPLLGFMEPTKKPFRDLIVAKEASRTVNTLLSNAMDEKPDDYWLYRTKKAPTRWNLMAVSAAFKYLVALEEPEIFCVYATLPTVYKDVFGKLYGFCADRMNESRLRRAVYTYLITELSSLNPKDAEKLFAGIDLEKALKKAVETEGEYLDEVFFPPEPEPEPEPEPDAVSGAETGGGEAAVVPEPEPDPEELERARLREAILAWMDGMKSKPPLEESVYGAMLTALKRGFVRGREKLEDATRGSASVNSLLKLIELNYSASMMLIDFMEGWSGLDELERASFIGALTEFSYASGDKTFIVLGAFIEERENLPAFNGYKDIALDFSLFALEEEPLEAEKAAMLVRDFLASDAGRLTDGSTAARETATALHPFDEESISGLVAQSDDWVSFIANCADALDALMP